MKEYKLAPSILAADFGALHEELAIVEKAGALYAHIDVMDGLFVPNISLGIPVIQSIRKKSKLVFDVHLMIVEPERYIDAFIDAGADIITFHVESTKEPLEAIKKIKARGKKAGISLKPQTDISALYPYLSEVDMVLVMSVNPGFGGQAFLPEAIPRTKELCEYLIMQGLKIDVEMDDGIGLQNAREVVEAGVNVIVAGSSVFGATDKEKAVHDFLKLFQER